MRRMEVFSMKVRRQQEILRIISQTDVETQDQLLTELRSCGVQATQATISRDVKELHLVKEPVGNGTYRYTRGAGNQGHNFAGRMLNIFREGVTAFDFAQNIVVIKTMPGLANAAAAALDGMDINGFVGSLAGDDTVLLIMRTNEDAEVFCDEIHNILH